MIHNSRCIGAICINSKSNIAAVGTINILETNNVNVIWSGERMCNSVYFYMYIINYINCIFIQ